MEARVYVLDTRPSRLKDIYEERECGPLVAVGPDVYDECHNK
jgi:hypothetical protein